MTKRLTIIDNEVVTGLHLNWVQTETRPDGSTECWPLEPGQAPMTEPDDLVGEMSPPFLSLYHRVQVGNYTELRLLADLYDIALAPAQRMAAEMASLMRVAFDDQTGNAEPGACRVYPGICAAHCGRVYADLGAAELGILPTHCPSDDCPGRDTPAEQAKHRA